MIERVLLDGADVALADVFASVTIRHGRGSADDGPLASSCSLTLVSVDRELVLSFSVADTLEILLAGDVPRFRGRVTDAALTSNGLSLVAVSSLGRLSEREVGAVDWPAETWSERLTRVFEEVGYAVTWTTFGETAWGDLDPSHSWEAPVDEPPVTIVVGDSDPDLAARLASPVALGQYLAELANTEPAAIANLPNGNILVQALSARRDFDTIALDPDLVALAPEWSMIDDVENAVTVEWDGGSVLREDFASIERFDPRPSSIQTHLEHEADAIILAALRLTRRATPSWVTDAAELLELDTTIGIGSPVILSDLPVEAPADTYLGMVEGWEDRVEVGEDGDLEWSMALTLSAPRLSGFGTFWRDVDPGISWDDAGAATWYSPTL